MIKNNRAQIDATKSLLSQLDLSGIISMITATVAVIGAGYLSNIPSVLLGEIFDSIVLEKSTASAWSSFQLIVTCLIGYVLLVLIQKFLVERTATDIQKSVFLENTSKILTVPVNSLQHLRNGEINARLEKRTHGMIRLLKLVFLETVPQLAVAIPALILTFTQSTIAGFVMLVVFMFSAAVTGWQIKSQKYIRINLINRGTGLAGQVAELLGHLDYIRVSGMKSRIKAQFEDETEQMRVVEFRHHKWMMGFDAMKSLIEKGGLAVIVGAGILQVHAGSITPGNIVAISILYITASNPLQNLHRIVDELHECVLQINSAHAVIDQADDTSFIGKTLASNTRSNPVIVAKNLSIRREVDGRKDTTVLDRLNFCIQAGEVVGIAGPSGGGKTTLLRAILGLFPNFTGSLTVFGEDIRKLDKNTLADKIVYCPQQPYVRQGSIGANLTEGVVRQGELLQSTIIESLERAHLPLSPSKMLNERGDNLSPGQCQRLSLARLFAKKSAQIAVLDEATSMLDGATQAKIIQEIKLQSKGRAVLMVAHRLETLKWADRILVMNNGKIVQTGTFDELRQMEGTFSDLLGHRHISDEVAAA